jgi:glutaredoxin
MDTCPFCRKVIRAIEEMGRDDIEMHDINRSMEDRERLVRYGGKLQVPCLFIDGQPMYERDDIIEWLRGNG